MLLQKRKTVGGLTWAIREISFTVRLANSIGSSMQIRATFASHFDSAGKTDSMRSLRGRLASPAPGNFMWSKFWSNAPTSQGVAFNACASVLTVVCAYLFKCERHMELLMEGNELLGVLLFAVQCMRFF